MNEAYANAKSANMLFVKELARRGEGRGVLAFSVHPGSESNFSVVWRVKGAADTIGWIAIQTNGFDAVPEEQKKTFGARFSRTMMYQSR